MSSSRTALWINDGSGHFDDETTQFLPEVFQSVAFSPTLTDLDGDGWLDLTLTGDYCTSRVYRNENGRAFREITSEIGVGTDENGMGSAVHDFDGDGRLDWFVTSVSYPQARSEGGCRTASTGCTGNRLWLNRDGAWEDATDRYGVREGKWGWGIAAQDLDNDGDRDLLTVNGFYQGELPPPSNPERPYWEYYLENQTRLWLNTGSTPWTQVAGAAGLTSQGLAKSVVPFDFDRDGDLDILISRSMGTPVLYRNDLDPENHWLGVELLDPASPNSKGVGARVEVTAVVGQRPQVAEIRTSGTFESSIPPEVHFGLGPDQTSVAQVVIRWPADGGVTTLTDVAVDQLLTIGPES